MYGVVTSFFAIGKNSAIARHAPIRSGGAKPGASELTEALRMASAISVGTPLDRRAVTHNARPRKNGADAAVLSCKSFSITVFMKAAMSKGAGLPFSCARSRLDKTTSFIVPTARSAASRGRHHIESPVCCADMDSASRLFDAFQSAATAFTPNLSPRESSMRPHAARTLPKSSSSSATNWFGSSIHISSCDELIVM